MAESLRPYVQMINHWQSQVWLGSSDAEPSTRRTLASNEVRNVVQRLCPEAFDVFYKDWHVALGSVATLETCNLMDVAKELHLQSKD